MVVAFAVGFVLGARAGRDRYEALAAFAQKLLGEDSPELPRRDEHGRFVARKRV
jgi:hypothetical protein